MIRAWLAECLFLCLHIMFCLLDLWHSDNEQTRSVIGTAAVCPVEMFISRLETASSCLSTSPVWFCLLSSVLPPILTLFHTHTHTHTDTHTQTRMVNRTFLSLLEKALLSRWVSVCMYTECQSSASSDMNVYVCMYTYSSSWPTSKEDCSGIYISQIGFTLSQYLSFSQILFPGEVNTNTHAHTLVLKHTQTRLVHHTLRLSSFTLWSWLRMNGCH